MPSLDPLYERLARLALATDDELAVAGGNAMRLHDFVDRPTEDLDLFTSRMGSIPALTERVRAAFEAAGLRVEKEAVSEHFARLTVEDADQRQAIVELVADPRTYPAVERDGLRVLDPREAATNKLNALWTRAEPRDFVDVDAAAGRYGRAQLVAWLAERDRGFIPESLAAVMADVDRRRAEEFTVHGLDARDLAALRDRFRLWRQELLSPPEESMQGVSDTL